MPRPERLWRRSAIPGVAWCRRPRCQPSAPTAGNDHRLQPGAAGRARPGTGRRGGVGRSSKLSGTGPATVSSGSPATAGCRRSSPPPGRTRPPSPSASASALSVCCSSSSRWSPDGPRVVPFPTENTGDWVLLRRSTEAHLQRRLAAQVSDQPHQSPAEPQARSRWTLKIRARAAASTKPALEQAARAELAALRAPQASRVRVDTTGATTARS